MGSNPGTGRYIVAQMTTYNGGPLSLGPIPSGRLKNLKDVDKWSSLSLYLPVRGECQLLVSWGTVPVQSDGLNGALSPVVYGDMALSINTQYNTEGKYTIQYNVDSRDQALVTAIPQTKRQSGRAIYQCLRFCYPDTFCMSQ